MTSSWDWTQVAKSIFDDDNHYTTCAPQYAEISNDIHFLTSFFNCFRNLCFFNFIFSPCESIHNHYHYYHTPVGVRVVEASLISLWQSYHPSQLWAIHCNSVKDKPVNSRMLSSHLFFSLLHLSPSTVLCRMIFSFFFQAWWSCLMSIPQNLSFFHYTKQAVMWLKGCSYNYDVST